MENEVPAAAVDSLAGAFSDTTLCIPLIQIAAVMILMSICLLCKKHKLGLLINFCFVFFWGFLFNRGIFVDLFGNTLQSLVFYLLGGVMMMSLCVYGFFFNKYE